MRAGQRTLDGDLHQVVGVFAMPRHGTPEAPQARQQIDDLAAQGFRRRSHGMV
jgi:hypothetical protein